MTTDQVASDAPITSAEFHASGYDKALRDELGNDSWAMAERLRVAATAADDAGQLRAGGVLHLLARVTSMMLTPEDKTTPFRPWAEFKDRRSPIPTDFTEDNVTLFAGVAATIAHPQLRARLADLVWVLDRKRGIALVPLAIDAYCETPLDSNNWFAGARAGWTRALLLALTIKDRARVATIEAALISTVLTAAGDDFLPLQVARLLLNNRLGAAVRGDIATRLQMLAETLAASGAYHQAIEYFEMAEKWHARSGARVEAIEMTVGSASCWETMGDMQDGGLSSLHSYENAIKLFRAVPSSDRAAHAIDARVTTLMRKVITAGQAAQGQMQTFRSGGQDITDLVNAAVAAVAGKRPLDALAAFAKIYQGVRVATIRKNAQATLENSLFGRLFGSSVISAQGNTIARQPAADEGASEAKAALWAQIVREYTMLIGIIVQGGIMPALAAMRVEHAFTIWDMEALCSASPFVPPDRVELLAQGLYAGYCGDMVQAIHILVPQVENIVRAHLQQAGAITATTSAEGIVMENGMSTLVKLPTMLDVFGDDLTFELTALFCDQNGPNLRNKVAHGLISKSACETDAGIYAWWLVFQLMFRNFWEAQLRAEQAATAPLTKGESSIL